MIKENTKKYFLISFLITFIFSPAYAYAGPGSAIGILIIIITVIAAFFSSILIKSFKLISKGLKRIKKSFSKNKKTSKK